MTYSLAFAESALKEWRKLSADIRQQLKSRLAERRVNPYIPAFRLHGFPDCYKIKLRVSGFRLVYQMRQGARSHRDCSRHALKSFDLLGGEEAALRN